MSIAQTADRATMRTAAEEAILARLPDAKARQHHWGNPAIAKQRDEARAILTAQGLPTRRIEDWKYTDLRTLMREAPEPFADVTREMVAEAEKATSAYKLAGATRALFVNGRCFATLKEDGFTFGSLANNDDLGPRMQEALSRRRDHANNLSVALNTLFIGDVTLIRIPARTALEKPLHLDFRNVGSQPFAANARVQIVVEEGASATILETHQGPNGLAYHSNVVVEIDLGAGARLEHVRIDDSGDKAISLSTQGTRLDRDAQFDSLSVVTGAAVSRHQPFLTFAGPHANANIRGAVMQKGRQHADCTLVADHRAPNCTSRETFKTVLDNEARGVFQGKIVVAQAAQKTDGKMAAHALLLSEDAEANSKPELEIFADDVVCGHGATVGALDKTLLFYLRARGLPEKEAQALLIEAFVGEAIEPVVHDGLRDIAVAAAHRWLATRG